MPSQAAVMHILDVGTVTPIQGTVGGASGLLARGVATIDGRYGFDTGPGCKQINPAGFTGYWNWNASTKLVYLNGTFSVNQDVMYADACLTGSGYNWGTDLHMEFDFYIDHINRWGGGIDDEIWVGFATDDVGPPYNTGPQIVFNSVSASFKPQVQIRMAGSNGTVITTPCLDCFINKTWTHATLDYYASNQTTIAQVGAFTLTLPSANWFGGGGFPAGTGMNLHFNANGFTHNYDAKILIDNMTSEKAAGGTYRGKWTSPVESAYPLQTAFLTYRLPRNNFGGAKGWMCPCYANRTSNLWAKTNSLASTGNAAVRTNITTGTSGSWASLPPGWVFEANFNTTTPIAAPWIQLLDYVWGSVPWTNPTGNPTTPGFFDWLPPLVFVAGVIVMVSTVAYSGFKWFRDNA